MELIRPAELQDDFFKSRNIPEAEYRAEAAAETEESLNYLRKQLGEEVELESGTPLETNDLIFFDAKLIDCPDREAKRYQRFQRDDVSVRLGSGFYNAEIEEKLIAKPLGSHLEFSISEPPCTVELHTKSGKRRLPLDDDEAFFEAAKASGIEEIENCHSYAELKTQMESYKFEEKFETFFISHIYSDMVLALAKASGIEINESDLQHERDKIAKSLLQAKEEENLDELEFYQAYLSPEIETIEQGRNKLEEGLNYFASLNKYGSALLEAENQVPSVEDYEKLLRETCEEEGLNEEQLRSDLPYEAYVESQAQTLLSQALYQRFMNYTRSQSEAH
ncbi:MAG: hypothetical protein Q4P72_00760 [Eubacteriales bacterium]|nr:hypothetical protein [Eubacteriales bacterium]